MTVDELLDALEASDFDALAGVSEDGAIDFKGAPYVLEREDAKYELAKDVASFAAHAGTSVIVFPVKTEKTPDSPFEKAVGARPITRGLIDEKQIRDLIKSRVYPTVRDVEVRTYASDADPEKFLVAIVIPEQRETDTPFLVLSPLAAAGEKVQGWLIGMPTRAGDNTDHIGASELHELIVRGRSVAARLEEIAAMVAHPPERIVEEARREHEPAPVPHAALEADALTARAREAAERFGTEESTDPHAWSGRWIPPTLFIEAQPIVRTSVPSLFREAGVRQLLERPPTSRQEGWNLTTLARAELVEGSKLELRNGRRKMLWLSDDGRFVAVARMIDFIARDRTSPDEERPVYKMNSLALIEYVHDFVMTYQALADYFDPPPAEARFSAVVLSATGTPSGDLFLPGGGVESLDWLVGFDGQLPDMANFAWGYAASLGADAGAIALPLLERVYAYFKNTAESIPYLSEERTAVDPELFSKVRR